MYRPEDFQKAGVGFHLLRAGIFVGRGDMVAQRFIHEGMGLSFNIEGSVFDQREAGECLIHPGDVICHWPQTLHKATEYQGQPLQTIWMELVGPSVPDVAHLFGATPSLPVTRPSNPEEIHTLFQEIVAGFHSPERMHPVLFGGVTMEAAFQRLRPWIRHTHIHDGGASQSPIEFKPCGQGIFDIPAFFRCLREMNYEGFVSGEWIDCTDTIDLASELARFRRLAAVRPGGCRTHGRMEIVSREINLPDSCTVKSLAERYEKMWDDPAHAQPLVTFAFIPDASVDRRAVLDDPAAMLDIALGVLEKNLSVPNDFIPMVRVEMGTVTVATAFGAEIMMNRNSPPAVLTHPIQSREDLEKAGRPDFRVAGLFPKAFEHTAYFREHLPEGVRQCHVDLQGPWNTAQLLGGNEIFLQTYDDPEFVGQMMDRVGEVMIAAVPEIKKAIGEEADCFYLQGLKFQGGCRACNNAGCSGCCCRRPLKRKDRVQK